LPYLLFPTWSALSQVAITCEIVEKGLCLTDVLLNKSSLKSL
jgi:hypothetical protein